MTISGTSEELFSGPATDYLGYAHDSIDCAGGTYPGEMEVNWWVGYSRLTSSLNAVDYLKENTQGSQAEGGNLPTYEIFLKGLEAAGLTEMLSSGEHPYLLFVPTDAAFKALPKERFDALMSDPEALAEVVRYHIAEFFGYPNANAQPVIVTNLLGDEWKFTDSETINGHTGNFFTVAIYVKNGTTLRPLDRLLQPPAQ
jgi:uncharacterized surface protein with fasciclin (FAS1) repeats